MPDAAYALKPGAKRSAIRILDGESWPRIDFKHGRPSFLINDNINARISQADGVCRAYRKFENALPLRNSQAMRLHLRVGEKPERSAGGECVRRDAGREINTNADAAFVEIRLAARTFHRDAEHRHDRDSVENDDADVRQSEREDFLEKFLGNNALFDEGGVWDGIARVRSFKNVEEMRFEFFEVIGNARNVAPAHSIPIFYHQDALAAVPACRLHDECLRQISAGPFPHIISFLEGGKKRRGRETILKKHLLRRKLIVCDPFRGAGIVRMNVEEIPRIHPKRQSAYGHRSGLCLFELFPVSYRRETEIFGETQSKVTPDGKVDGDEEERQFRIEKYRLLHGIRCEEGVAQESQDESIRDKDGIARHFILEGEPHQPFGEEKEEKDGNDGDFRNREDAESGRKRKGDQEYH